MSTLDFGYGDAGFMYSSLGLLGTDSVSWSFEEDKFFETNLAQYDGWPITGDDYWGQLQQQMPQKAVQELKDRYAKLKEDIREIESGFVSLPEYYDEGVDSEDYVTAEVTFAPMKTVKAQPAAPAVQAPAPAAPPAKKSKNVPKTGDQERRKGVPWTEEEHRLFLLGLNKFGKGDWRSISRNFVVTRTPTQVASHAQKYFIRLNSMSKKDNKRRSSIHDITSATGRD
jgi:SHAQKYF class myb-like DNA-binding protein